MMSNKRLALFTDIIVNLDMSDQKNRKEASTIFHTIMKASVSKKATEKKEKKEVKQKNPHKLGNG